MSILVDSLFKLAFIVGFGQFDLVILWCSFLHIFVCFNAWSSLNFLDLWVYAVHQIWKIFTVISSNFVLSFLSRTQIV